MATRLPPRIPLALLAIATISMLGSLALATLQHDLHFNTLETEVSFWGRGNYMPTDDTRTSTAEGIQQLVESAPKNANYHALQASQLAWESYWQQNKATAGQATQAQQQSLNWRPARIQDQQLMVEYSQRTDATQPAVEAIAEGDQAATP
jgi:hypothetical protein